MGKEKGLTRRGFISLAGVASGVAAGSLMGCSPTSQNSAEGTQEAGVPTTHDWLGEEPAIDESMITETLTTDVLIVGAGNGGMAAAVVAAHAGIDFIICEKMSMVAETRSWVGAVNTKWHKEAGITVDEGKLLNELTRYASGRCDQSVWNTWIRESAATVEFLEEITQAEGFSVFLDTEGYDHPTGGTDYYVPPVQHMWYDKAAGGPSALAGDMSSTSRNAAFERYLIGKGYEVAYDHELVKLNRDGQSGRVTSAIFATGDGYTLIEASKGIVLTAGGYGANPVMVEALNPITPSAVTMNTATPSCTGDGIKAALHIGAEMDEVPATMIFDRGITSAGVDTGYIGEGEDAHFPEAGGATDGMVIGSLPFMKVNRKGRRFFNESAPYDWCTFAATKQPGGVWCSVFDSHAAEDAIRFSVIGCAKTATQLLQMGPVEAVFAQPVEEGKLVVADTLEDLAEKLELPVEEFLDEVERYNAMFDNQKDSDFGKEAFRLSAVKEPPFYGFWSGGQFFTTLDGLCINADMQVLDAKKEVIEGLYAAGDCSGSLYAGNYPEYIVGNACGRTMTFARHAVLHMTDSPD